MALTLTSDDTARLDAATRVLLSPLVAPDLDAWMLEAGARVRDVLGGDLALVTPPSPERFYSLCPEAPSFLAAVERTARAADGDIEFVDPVLTAWYARIGQEAATTWEANRRIIEPEGFRMEDSAFVSEGLRPAGLDDFASLHLLSPAGFASFVVLGEQRGRFRFGEDAGTALSLLAPAFRAGLDAVATVAAQRSALGATLDAFAEPALVLDADGRERHRNRALTALLDAEPERTAVDLALWQTARDVRRLAFTRRHESAPPVLVPRTAATARGRYTVAPTLVPAGLLGAGEMALVTVRAEVHPVPPTPAEVMARTGLSAREAEVALLVAEGLSNAQIAERLFVATGTVKRHVENVLAKLDLAGRAGVAARLVSLGGVAP